MTWVILRADLLQRKFRVVIILLILLLLAFASMPARSETKAEIAELERAHTDLKSGRYQDGFRRIHRVADKGSPAAQHVLGQLYERGIGVEKNLGKAAQYYQRAANRDFAAAETRLGVMLRTGDGIAKNPMLAEKWLMKASQHDVGEAQYNLGQMHLHGEATAPNLAAASQWLRRAAANGVSQAETALAQLPQVKPITQEHGAGLQYHQSMSNLEQSWQGYKDLTATLEKIDSTASRAKN
jgi:TPR repeat protein